MKKKLFLQDGDSFCSFPEESDCLLSFCREKSECALYSTVQYSNQHVLFIRTLRFPVLYLVQHNTVQLAATSCGASYYM